MSRRETLLLAMSKPTTQKDLKLARRLDPHTSWELHRVKPTTRSKSGNRSSWAVSKHKVRWVGLAAEHRMLAPVDAWTPTLPAPPRRPPSPLPHM